MKKWYFLYWEYPYSVLQTKNVGPYEIWNWTDNIQINLN